jgi:hypothetical protein
VNQQQKLKSLPQNQRLRLANRREKLKSLPQKQRLQLSNRREKLKSLPQKQRLRLSNQIKTSRQEKLEKITHLDLLVRMAVVLLLQKKQFLMI